jgi:hypothetical protein
MTLQGNLGGISLIDIPDFDEVITRSRGKDVRGCGVEDDLSDLSTWVS